MQQAYYFQRVGIVRVKMLIINTFLIGLSIIFLLVFSYRIKPIKKVLLNATILNIKEEKRQEQELYYKLTYYYPKLEYEYEYHGCKYIGYIDEEMYRQYKVPKLSSLGKVQEDNKYFWRSLNKGDSIKIYIDPKRCKRSWLFKKESKSYTSETYVFLIFPLLLIATLFYLNSFF